MMEACAGRIYEKEQQKNQEVMEMKQIALEGRSSLESVLPCSSLCENCFMA
jgi:hypothetical protein